MGSDQGDIAPAEAEKNVESGAEHARRTDLDSKQAPGPEGGTDSHETLPLVLDVDVEATVGRPILAVAAVDEPLLGDSWHHPSRVTLDGGALEDLVLRAVSIRGRAHVAGRQDREDAYAFAASPTHLVVAVADGAGDERATQSALGAGLAAQGACRILRRRARQGRVDCGRVVGEIAAYMLAKSDVAADQGGVLSTTLLAAWIDISSGHFDGFLVGDGIVAQRRRAAWELLSHPEGAVTNRLPLVLPHLDAPVAQFRGALQPGGALLLATDGITWGPAVAEHLHDALEVPPTTLRYATHLNFERRGELDDRTAVTVWRVGNSDPGVASGTG